ncbi:peptidase U32 family protein [Paenibacillus piscarius]|uniref:peptidase U32 family protein n=1 Tax=Paenibacillus piscarius TaxID=1089681 RepID=UPI001EE95AAA|nr:U32 family peptidase [Paenibacillus piscarius]
MKIMAPAISFDTARQVIEAGAEEIYLGGDDGVFRTYSFTGRGKASINYPDMNCPEDELRGIVNYAHDRGIKVNYLCNTPFFYNGAISGDMENHYLAYAEKGVHAGVDALVIGDLGLLNITSKQGFNVKLHASVFFKTLNLQQILFLEQFGVERVVLSYHICMEEIEALCSRSPIEIEVIGYLGCSFFNGACGFLHDLGEGAVNDFDPGISCKGVYSACCEGKQGNGRIFDVEKGCAICSLHRLEQSGVNTLKIVGRDRDYKRTVEVIRHYKSALEHYRNGEGDEQIRAGLPNWWTKIWCSGNRCKYSDHAYLIGG